MCLALPGSRHVWSRRFGSEAASIQWTTTACTTASVMWLVQGDTLGKARHWCWHASRNVVFLSGRVKFMKHLAIESTPRVLPSICMSLNTGIHMYVYTSWVYLYTNNRYTFRLNGVQSSLTVWHNDCLDIPKAAQKTIPSIGFLRKNWNCNNISNSNSKDNKQHNMYGISRYWVITRCIPIQAVHSGP